MFILYVPARDFFILFLDGNRIMISDNPGYSIYILEFMGACSAHYNKFKPTIFIK